MRGIMHSSPCLVLRSTRFDCNRVWFWEPSHRREKQSSNSAIWKYGAWMQSRSMAARPACSVKRLALRCTTTECPEQHIYNRRESYPYNREHIRSLAEPVRLLLYGIVPWPCLCDAYTAAEAHGGTAGMFCITVCSGLHYNRVPRTESTAMRAVHTTYKIVEAPPSL